MAPLASNFPLFQGTRRLISHFQTKETLAAGLFSTQKSTLDAQAPGFVSACMKWENKLWKEWLWDCIYNHSTRIPGLQQMEFVFLQKNWTETTQPELHLGVKNLYTALVIPGCSLTEQRVSWLFILTINTYIYMSVCY